jgi:outer membrane receptor protein involved in Fe transport
MRSPFAIAALLLLAARPLPAQSLPPGSVSGVVRDSASRAPLENVSVALRDRADSTHAVQVLTGVDGAFHFPHVRTATYDVVCTLVGHRPFRSPPFRLSDEAPAVTLPPIALRSAALVLREVEVSASRGLVTGGLDRHVYQVDHDVMAKSSTASELLQNIPSVQVDLDGNVSLRGSPDVTILVNGHKSTLMGSSRAEVLQQLPAAGIERIEVITNPSARFTPEGSSGVINIVTKKSSGGGWNSDVTGHVGAAGRHNENVTLGAHPGTLEMFGSYSFRDDLRHRDGTDARELLSTGDSYREDNHLVTHLAVHLANAALTWRPTKADEIEWTANYFHRRPARDGVSTIVTRDASGSVLSDEDRAQSGFELEPQAGATAAFQHDFATPDRQLRMEVEGSNNPQTESVHFTELWRAPVQPGGASDVVVRQQERLGHVTLDYASPLGDGAKLETGYALELHRQDIRSIADSLDGSSLSLAPDPTRTYRFRLDQAIHAAYATYQRALAGFDVLAGLRGEYATVSSDLVTGSPGFKDTDASLYPTLHVGHALGARTEVRASYSRRIRRPESDDLNPFPEYTDPYNIDAGNPRLKPESIHSFELGGQLRTQHVTFSPSLYYRLRTDAFTRVTTVLGDSTFLRTMENLGRDRAAGFEPVVTLTGGRWLQANLDANVFDEQIDASNLGFHGTRSVVSWSGTGNATFTPGTRTALELNATYRSVRLTPQGSARPSFGLNLGARRTCWGERLSLTLAVTDLLRTQVQGTSLDVDDVRQRVTNHRDARVAYLGATWHFGRTEPKKDKDHAIEYEDQP